MSHNEKLKKGNIACPCRLFISISPVDPQMSIYYVTVFIQPMSLPLRPLSLCQIEVMPMSPWWFSGWRALALVPRPRPAGSTEALTSGNELLSCSRAAHCLRTQEEGGGALCTETGRVLTLYGGSWEGPVYPWIGL